MCNGSWHRYQEASCEGTVDQSVDKEIEGRQDKFRWDVYPMVGIVSMVSSLDQGVVD